MRAEHWIAIAGLVLTLLIVLGGALVAHIRHDERREARLTQVEQEMGTHETGLRGRVHEHTNALTWLGGCLWYVANKLGIELPKRDGK